MRNARTRIALWGAFVALIVGGVVMKRIFDLPAWVPVLHITALLVLIAISITAEREHAADEADDVAPPAWDEV